MKKLLLVLALGIILLGVLPADTSSYYYYPEKFSYGVRHGDGTVYCRWLTGYAGENYEPYCEDYDDMSVLKALSLGVVPYGIGN